MKPRFMLQLCFIFFLATMLWFIDRSSFGHAALQDPTPSSLSTYLPISNQAVPTATPTPYPKVLASGVRPFLNALPFAVSYTAVPQLNSYFDHRLPVYGSESLTAIPTEIRDSDRNHTALFLGEERVPTEVSRLDQGYAWYSGHNGLDYGLRSDVLAPANGVIAGFIASTSYPDICGVWINHDASEPHDGLPDYTTNYLHLLNLGQAPEREIQRENRECGTSNHWCVGDTIRQGEVIGIAGTRPCGGSSDGVHLHFALAEGTLKGDRNPRLFDPFGWWSNLPDPWTDSRLPEVLSTYYSPGSSTYSYWMWGTALNPAPGEPGHWGTAISAQVDDLDPGFHKFGSLARKIEWTVLSYEEATKVKPIGSGAWLSKSLDEESDQSKKNSAVWGLYVPAAGTYQIQVYLPKLSAGLPAATDLAVYHVRFPLDNDSFNIWDSAAVDQRRENEWVTLSTGDEQTDFALLANSTLLVELDDVTGKAGDTVIFDAVRLKQISLDPSPDEAEIRRVGFVMDNSSSMLNVGKISAVKSAVPIWIDKLTTLGLPYQYAFNRFANNVITNGVTEDPVVIKSWIASLSGNDNGVSNSECPEASLDAIRQLAPDVASGDILLFTDDISFSAYLKNPGTLLALLKSGSRLHAILLPKTCTFDGTTNADFLYFRILALLTGGTYQRVTTTNTTAALDIVLQEMKANTQIGYQVLANHSHALDSEAIATYQVLLDSSLSQVNFLMDILSGAPLLEIRRPDGTVLIPTDPDVNYINSGAGVYYSVQSPAAGNWSATVAGTGEHLFRVTGESNLRFTYLGDTYAGIGESIQLVARLDGPVSSPVFTVEDTQGNLIANVLLQDEGKQGDYYADDGVYVGQFTPSIAGDFRLRAVGQNEFGQTISRTDARLIRVRSVSVQAPPPMQVFPGEEAVFHFTVTNAGTMTETYDLSATSGNGWLMSSMSNKVTVGPMQSVDVPLPIAVPTNAVPNTVDIIRLTAVNTADVSIVAEDSSNIMIPDVDEQDLPTVLYLPFLIH